MSRKSLGTLYRFLERPRFPLTAAYGLRPTADELICRLWAVCCVLEETVDFFEEGVDHVGFGDTMPIPPTPAGSPSVPATASRHLRGLEGHARPASMFLPDRPLHTRG